MLTLQKHTDLSDHGAKLLCDKLLNNIDNLERLQELVLWHSMDCKGKSGSGRVAELRISKEYIDGKSGSYEDQHTDNIRMGGDKSTCCQPFKNKIISSTDNQIRLTPPSPLKRDLSLSDMDAVHRLQRFLLSVTAKDVSLLLTFRLMNEGNNVEEEVGEDTLPIIEMKETGKRFRVMMSVIDLDPKPVHRIRHWVKRKEEWLKIYSDSISSSKPPSASTKDV